MIGVVRLWLDNTISNVHLRRLRIGRIAAADADLSPVVPRHVAPDNRVDNFNVAAVSAKQTAPKRGRAQQLVVRYRTIGNLQLAVPEGRYTATVSNAAIGGYKTVSQLHRPGSRTRYVHTAAGVLSVVPLDPCVVNIKRRRCNEQTATLAAGSQGLVVHNRASGYSCCLALDSIYAAALERRVAPDVAVGYRPVGIIKIQPAADSHIVPQKIAVRNRNTLSLDSAKSAAKAEIRTDTITDRVRIRIARISNSRRVVISHMALGER